MWTRGPWAILLSVPLVAACAGVGSDLGRNATRGALDEVENQLESTPPHKQGLLGERAGAGMTRGSLDTLSDPERSAQLGKVLASALEEALRGTRAQSGDGAPGTGGSGSGDARIGAPPWLQAMATQLADGIAAGVVRRLEVELAAGGKGRLSGALTASGEEITSASVARLKRDLLAESGCGQVPTAACVELRAYDLGVAVSHGMVRGARWPLLTLMTLTVVLSSLGVIQLGRSTTWFVRSLRRKVGPGA